MLTTATASRALPGGGPVHYTLQLYNGGLYDGTGDTRDSGGGTVTATSDPDSGGDSGGTTGSSEGGLPCSPYSFRPGPFDGRLGDLADYFRANPVHFQQATDFLERNTQGWECRSRAISDLDDERAVAGWMIRLAHGGGDGVVDRPAESEAGTLVDRWIGGPVELPGIDVTVDPTGGASGGSGGSTSGGDSGGGILDESILDAILGGLPWNQPAPEPTNTTTSGGTPQSGRTSTTPGIDVTTLLLAGGVILAVVLATRKKKKG